jgi:hypothetical protein
MAVPRTSITLPLLLVCLAVIAPSPSAAEDRGKGRLAAGDVFPDLTGEFLTGRKATLPAAAQGRVAMVALGFSYGSRFAVEQWSKRFRAEFSGNPRATFYEVPMIGGMGRIGRVFIDRGMRKGTQRELHENVITVYGGTGPWKERLAVSDDKWAYLALIDGRGVVRWLHAGLFDEGHFREMAAIARQLASEK